MSRAALLLAVCVLFRVHAAAPDGAAVFQKNCVVCHKPDSENRAPLPEAMGKTGQERIVKALESGTMKAQGASLTADERAAVADYLVKTFGGGRVETAKGFCAVGYEPTTNSSFWNGWGVDLANTRMQPANMAGLTAAQVPKLQLKWAFGFPNSASAMAQPALVGGRLYFGSFDGTVFSADAKTGCIFWSFKADATVRTAISVGAIRAGRYALMFGDVKANVYAVDGKDGSVVWKSKVEDHPVARITGAPKLVGSRLYVPVSSIEEVSGGSPKYECCTFRGSVVALDAESGKQVWKTYAIPDPPKATKKNASGTQLKGPAGAAIWLSPTIDRKRNVLYVGTGNGYSDPLTKYSDAVIAMDLDTGGMKWVQQLTPKDGWNFSCVNPSKASCPEDFGEDVDIGASPILKELPGGKSILLIGQKSGVVHALDPDQQGKILWQTRVGKGGALGGIQWGMAADNDNVYVALSDVAMREKAGGLFALKLTTGEKVWYAEPEKPECLGRGGCTPAQMAPVTVIPGVVFSGAMDGVLRAYDAKTGKVVWSFNTLREFETVNGVKAKGGSLSATGPVIANGMLYVNSGYGALGGMGGNVLLAFSVQ